MSLETLVKQWNELCKFYKGYVAMKGVKKNGLYVLLGKIVCGSTNAYSDTLIDRTEVWHKRLGHISEKGLYYLSKQSAFG